MIIQNFPFTQISNFVKDLQTNCEKDLFSEINNIFIQNFPSTSNFKILSIIF